jgi:hypothetical protein
MYIPVPLNTDNNINRDESKIILLTSKHLHKVKLVITTTIIK